MLMVTPRCCAQSSSKIDVIAELIGIADHEELSNHFNTLIELSLPENEGTYSKTQSKFILKDFFKKNPPVSFEIKHQGESNNGSLYAIGTYKTRSNEYRTYYLLKLVNGKYLIHLMQINRQ